MKLTNKAYDVLKFIAQILLPALGTLYFALAKIWGFPYAAEIVGTISAVDASWAPCWASARRTTTRSRRRLNRNRPQIIR